MTIGPRRWLWSVSVSAAAVLVFASACVAFGQTIVGSAVGTRGASDRLDPCLPGRAVPILPSPHIPVSAARSVHYNSEPPTSGPHFAFAAPPGVYRERLPDGRTVHTLEHGHIVIQYGAAVPADVVRQLEQLAHRYPEDVLVAPRPSLADTIAFTAWSRILTMTRYSAADAAAFILALRGRYDHGWSGPDDVCQSP